MLARKTCWADPELGHGDGLPLQVADRADLLGPEQLEAADVAPRQDNDWVPRVHPNDDRRGEVHVDVSLARGQGLPRSLQAPPFLTYCTSVNPSPRRSSSATYWGA